MSRNSIIAEYARVGGVEDDGSDLYEHDGNLPSFFCFNSTSTSYPV